MTLEGQKIVKINTINSIYADGQLEAIAEDGAIYRLPVTTVMQIVNDFNFKGEMKRKYIHLTQVTPAIEA